MAKSNGVPAKTAAKSPRTTSPRGTAATRSSAARRRAAAPAAAPDAGAGARKNVAAKKPRLPKAVAAAVRAALDKQATDVVVLDLRPADGFTDYFVICTGNNPRQVKAIADGVDETLRATLGERPALAEGVDRSEWILLDYFDFVVHVFSRDCRSFYALDRLWGNALRHEFANEP